MYYDKVNNKLQVGQGTFKFISTLALPETATPPLHTGELCHDHHHASNDSDREVSEYYHCQ